MKNFLNRKTLFGIIFYYFLEKKILNTQKSIFIRTWHMYCKIKKIIIIIVGTLICH